MQRLRSKIVAEQNKKVPEAAYLSGFPRLVATTQTPLCKVVMWCFSLILRQESRSFIWFLHIA